MFNPETFLTQGFQGPVSDKYIPIPKGEYQATITSVEIRMPKDNPLLELRWTIIAPEEPLAHEQEARQSFWLDITEEGQLDTGKNKNVKLGKLLSLFRINATGGSLMQLQGQIGIVTIDHRESNGETYAEVSMVAQ